MDGAGGYIEGDGIYVTGVKQFINERGGTRANVDNALGERCIFSNVCERAAGVLLVPAHGVRLLGFVDLVPVCFPIHVASMTPEAVPRWSFQSPKAALLQWCTRLSSNRRSRDLSKHNQLQACYALSHER